MIFISFLLQVFVKDLRLTHYYRTLIFRIPTCRFHQSKIAVNRIRQIKLFTQLAISSYIACSNLFLPKKRASRPEAKGTGVSRLATR